MYSNYNSQHNKCSRDLFMSWHQLLHYTNWQIPFIMWCCSACTYHHHPRTVVITFPTTIRIPCGWFHSFLPFVKSKHEIIVFKWESQQKNLFKIHHSSSLDINICMTCHQSKSFMPSMAVMSFITLHIWHVINPTHFSHPQHSCLSSPLIYMTCNQSN